MTRYYGIKCGKCEEPIPLALYQPSKGRNVIFNLVPLREIPCPKCGHSQQYESKDSMYFDGPDDLPLSLPA